MPRPDMNRWRVLDSVLAVIVSIGLIVGIVYLLAGRRGFDGNYVALNYPLFLEAAQVTLFVTTVSYVLGMGIGFPIGWIRVARPTPLPRILRDFRRWQPKRRFPVRPILVSGLKYFARRLTDAYVELIRGTPLLVQIVFIWSVLIVYYPRLDNLVLIAGIAALTANTAGYQGEIFRAGLRTVQAGQAEAGRALGLSRWKSMRYVVLPQALRLVIPPLTNEYIGLLKISSLLVFLGIREVTLVGQEQAFLHAKVFEGFFLVTGIYLLITVPLSKMVEYLERRYRIPGLGIQQQVRVARVGA